MIISYYWPPLCISKENMVEEVTVTRIDVEEETVSTTGFMHILSVDNDDCIWFGDLSGGSHRLSDLHLVAGELNIRDASDVLRDRYNETLCHMHDQAKGPGLNLDYTETLLPRPSLPERRTVGRIIGEETESSSISDGGGGGGINNNEHSNISFADLSGESCVASTCIQFTRFTTMRLIVAAH